MRTRKRRIKLQRFCDSRLCLRHSPLCRRPPLLRISQPKIGHRQFSVSRRKSRVLLDGLVEVSYRFLGIRFAESAGEIQSAQVIVLRLRVHGTIDSKPSPLLWYQLDLDFIRREWATLADEKDAPYLKFQEMAAKWYLPVPGPEVPGMD